MNRRSFLKVAGTSSVILAATSIGFVTTRNPTQAQKPWTNVGEEYSDPMKQALSYAILAPNPHNRQPWIVDLISETEAVLSCDLDRLLPVTDPFSRQITIGLGCFLELFSIAASQNGYRATIKNFPDGEPGAHLDQRPIAHLSLKKEETITRDVFFDEILNRHTNREPYDINRPIDAAILNRLNTISSPDLSIKSTHHGQELEDLRILSRDAMRMEIMTPAAFQESIDLMRIGRTEIETNPDGIALKGAFLESLNLLGILTRESLADPTSDSFQIGIDMSDKSAMSSMGFVWITTSDNSRISQINAGRAYMRVCLQLTKDNIVMQPMSQTLQEYVEMTPFYNDAHHQLTDQPSERVQMLARLGYAKDVGAAPRWPLETRLKET